MTYTPVFPLVGGAFTAAVAVVHPAAMAAGDGGRAGYFQRVDSRKPRMMKPNPMAMFQTPMEPIG